MPVLTLMVAPVFVFKSFHSSILYSEQNNQVKCHIIKLKNANDAYIYSAFHERRQEIMTYVIKKLAVVFIATILLFGYICVFNSDDGYAATKKIHLKKTTISLVAKKTYQQKLIDKKGKTIKATKVKWKSKKTAVAKINKKGKVTAVKPGTAKMTAKYKGKTYKFTVKVKTVPVSSITATKSSVTLGVGDSKKISLTINPSNATNKKIIWESTDDSIVSVDENGVVTGNKMGWVDVKATVHNGKTATIRVRVEKIWFDNTAYSVGVGETKTVKLYGNVLLGLNISYYTTYMDLSIGSYNSDDQSFEVTITGKKPGKVSITAFDKNYNVDSVKAVADIQIMPTEESIAETETTIHDYIIKNGKENPNGSGITGDYYIESRVAPSSTVDRIVLSAFVSQAKPWIYMYSINYDGSKYILMLAVPDVPKGQHSFDIYGKNGILDTRYWGEITVSDYTGKLYGEETGLFDINKTGPAVVTDETELFKIYKRTSTSMKGINQFLNEKMEVGLVDFGYINYEG